ncbi:Chemotaxis protein CheY [Fervidicola ferrireducens]|uniref:Stage 0 sporulation protein A homolog n=1 Tax=Fervidicola ferrireducens TaxID=520764 RepID=A0A140LE48_9FIRM|nr:response regulator [Fervidicola ferrireducens]KXG78823.1 Chemotaxis protein CheY [Fervidicola ferrireducens]
MDFRIIVVDDDRAVRRMLTGIIENNGLGEVIAEAGDGEEAERKIIALNPDIALIDLLLPSKDGIEVIRESREKGVTTYFIMISQVEAQDMISKAYEAGIEFFVHKPINVTETVNVISKVEEMIKLKTTFMKIKETVSGLGMLERFDINKPEMTKIDLLLAELGILGETGSEDIKVLVENFDRVKKTTSNLQEIYRFLQEYYMKTGRKKSSDLKAIEMRIRRAITKALGNIASMGMEDFDGEQFLRYASVLFEFKEVKKQMDFLRGKTSEGGKINVKKFLEGIAFLCRT